MKVYLAKLKRKDVKPTCVYKVGITSSYDALDRLMYKGPDELFPISNYFEDIKVMKSIYVSDRTTAELVEKFLMKSISGESKFHNWYERDQISGITEMRVWDYDEYLKVRELMDNYENESLYQTILSEHNANITRVSDIPAEGIQEVQ
jgi:hypothetical protein